MLFLAASFWPAFYGTRFLQENKALAVTWLVSCVTMSVFTLLEALKTESLTCMLVCVH